MLEGRERTRRDGGQSAPSLKPILDRNIRSLYERRRREIENASWHAWAADAVTTFTGSIPFVYLHLALFGFWIVANLGWIPGVPVWDQSFVVLAMIASVEAIFLSTFVLISQNRIMADADRRADLDLQVSLLTEHELTKLASLVSDIASRLGVRPDPELEAVKEDVNAEAVLDEIEKAR